MAETAVVEAKARQHQSHSLSQSTETPFGGGSFTRSHIPTFPTAIGIDQRAEGQPMRA